jgi:hypothetical protein
MRRAEIGRMQKGCWIVSLAVLAGCGGGGSSNSAPTANAGTDQTVNAGNSVVLAGTGTDSDGTISTYVWTQTAGPTVSLNSANVAQPSFTAPLSASAATLTFSLIVRDNSGTSSVPDSVTVTVQAGVTISGAVTFARVPFNAMRGEGLNYLGERQDPARNITVNAISNATSLATTTTDSAGNYSLLVPANTQISIQAQAEMLQFKVRDVDNSTTPYNYAGAAFNSGAAASTQNLTIPSGWNAVTRIADSTRASAPFAILDTVYKAYNFILAVAPTAVFPQLTLDWAPTNPGSETFYDSASGNDRRIVLAGEADVDTDEFDEHVIAHEFGHYIENIFSRSDNIGGTHAPGDRLDPRVAFGEGFGYAFAAMVLDDPIPRDSFGTKQTQDGSFSIEQDTNITGSGGGSTEGWYSEASVQEILWDVFDSVDDGADHITMGFAPIWQVLTTEEKTTEALTSIFSFITALKAENPADASGISALVTNEAMVGTTINAFGTTETNKAGASNTLDVLPVYTPITLDGGTQVVRSVGTYGTTNKLSNHRFLSLDVASPVSVRITASGPSGHDVDLLVLHQGAVVATGDAVGDENFTTNLSAGRYVLDTYDCENANCSSSDSPSPSAVDITVAVTHN